MKKLVSLALVITLLFSVASTGIVSFSAAETDSAPISANGVTFLSDEMAEKFVNLFYSGEQEAAEEVRDILKGNKEGTFDQIKDIIDKSADVFGLFDEDTLAEFSGKVAALAVDDVSYLLDTASSVLSICANGKSFVTSKDSSQKVVDALQVFTQIVKLAGYSEYIPSGTSAVLASYEMALALGSYLQTQYFQEQAQMYEMSLIIEYSTNQELTYQEAPTLFLQSTLTQEEADSIYQHLYLKYVTKRIMDRLGISMDDYDLNDISNENPTEPNSESPTQSNTENPTQPTTVVRGESELNNDTYEKDSRCVPNYVLTGSTVQPMYNPSQVNMLADMSNLAYDLNNSDPSWKNDLNRKYGYTQFYHVVNSGTYLLGTKKENETYIGDDGKEHVQQVTKEKMFSACNATVAFKETTYNGEKLYAIAVAFKGTNFGDYADVLADISIISNSDGIHSGFANNSAAFYEQSKNIFFAVDGESVSLYDMIQDMKNESSPYRLLVTGHSLGGALADVFVGYHLFKDGISPRNIMTYAFEPPKSCKSTYSYANLKNNIVNIINNDDLVTAVGAQSHIGKTFIYTPNDAFRERHYGEAFEAGHDSAWWQDNLHAMVFQGAPTHMVYKEVAQVFNFVDADGNAYVDNCTPYHTRGNNMWSSVTLDSKCYWEINGNLTITGKLTFEEGRMEVGGDCEINDMRMTHETDYLLVNGDFTKSGYYWTSTERDGVDNLSAGTIEIKGDFSQLGTLTTTKSAWTTMYCYYYCESGTHKTILSGDNTQTVSFELPTSYNKFENLFLINSDINFVTPVYKFKLNQDTELINTELLSIVSLIDFNGFTLKTNGDVKASSLQTNGGNADIAGNLNSNFVIDGNYFYVQGEATTSNSTIAGKLCKITGNLTVTGKLTFEEGRMEVGGDCEINDMRMTHETDYLLVNGDFTKSGYYWTSTERDGVDNLSAGTIEIKGDFSQLGTLTTTKSAWTTMYCYYYCESGTHKTILSGDNTQTVSFEHPTTYNRFNILAIENNSSGGVVFDTNIRVNTLFNHNRNTFTLFNNGSGSTFVDFDRDGMKDNVDPYPLDPYNNPPKVPSFTGHSISLNGDIGINFYIDVSDEDVNNGNVKVDFTWNVEGTEKTYLVTLSSDDKYALGYKASCPVPAAEMTYDVTATIIINDIPLKNTDTYSAQKYAKVILNNENNFRDKYIAAENEKGRNGEQRYSDLITLIQTMLDYGTKAQVVFNRDTEHPANEGTDFFNDDTNPVSTDMITITEENMDMDLSAYGLRYKGSTVVYLSETSIRHYYYVDDWDSFNEIKDSVTFDGAAVTYTEKDDAIYFEKKGVSASDLDTPYTLIIRDKSCKFAVNDYIRHCLESTKVSDNTKALVKATYRYNVAANAFFEV